MIIVGPILKDLERIGLDGERVDIATAFYSERAFMSLATSPKVMRIMCRLNFDDTREWELGYISPDGLLRFIHRCIDGETRIKLYSSPQAHVKAYVGEKGALIGSSNLTLPGFGGGFELLQYTHGASFVNQIRQRLTDYCKKMEEVRLARLESFVKKHETRISKIQAKKNIKDRLPEFPTGRKRQVGDFKEFLKWLSSKRSASAREVYERAYGKGNLSGHINRNFYGIRQYFLAYPEMVERFSHIDSDTYKLSADQSQEARITEFVKNHASDEDEFVLDIWKTYLPIECGGRAGKHGGTIGNLNRMLPLIAHYLNSILVKRLRS